MLVFNSAVSVCLLMNDCGVQTSTKKKEKTPRAHQSLPVFLACTLGLEMVSGYFSIHMRWDFSLGGKSDSTVRLSGLNLCVCIHFKLGRTHRNCCHKHCTVIEDKRTRLTEQLKRMLRINLSLSSLSTPPCSEYQRSEIYFLCWDILCLRGLICPLGKYINLYLTQNVFLVFFTLSQ